MRVTNDPEADKTHLRLNITIGLFQTLLNDKIV